MPYLLRLSAWLKNSAYFLLFALFIAEITLSTWKRNYFGPFVSPVILYLLSALLCFATLSCVGRRRWEISPIRQPIPLTGHWLANWPRRLALATGLVAGAWYTTNLIKREIRSFEPILEYGDIIPAIQAFARRWLAGVDLHTPFTWELGYYELPGYLPGTWFPFVLAEWLGFDYRYISWGIFLLGIIGYAFVVWRLYTPWPHTLLLALLPFGVFYAFIINHWAYIGITVEDMVLGYYTLLVVGILLNWWPLQALALVLCLLSRYSLALWLPLYFGLLFFQQSKKQALLVAGTVIAGIIGLYIIPFLSHRWGLFIEVLGQYKTSAWYEWQHLGDDGLPIHLYNGLGLSSFFHHYGHGSLYDRIATIQITQVCVLVVLVTLMGIYYYRQQVPRTDYRVFLVVMLKLYLATFYAFIQVPYAYLTTLSAFMSVFLLLIVVGINRKSRIQSDKFLTSRLAS